MPPSGSGGGGGATTGPTTTGAEDAGTADAPSSGTADAAGPDATSATGGPDGGGSGGDAAGGPASMCTGTIYSTGDVCGPAVAAGKPCTLITGTHASACPACTKCPFDGQLCCPASAGDTTGYKVSGLLLGGKDTVTFTNVYAPADGDYNIVWYYRCGNADTDNNYPPTCPGSKEGSTTGPPGCRQALFTVNGVTDPMTYQIPCFLRTEPGDGWSNIHSWVRDDPATKALVPFHLKAGSNNTIKIFAGNHDTVDLAAIRVPDGK